MTTPAIFAAVTPINSPHFTFNNRLISPLIRASFHNCSLTIINHNPNPNPSPNNRRSNQLLSIKATTASDSTAIVDNPASASTSKEEIPTKIGAKVRVKVPLKVYHIPKLPEVELKGKEGKIKDYIAVWKGKHISANLPYKIEFFEKLEGRGDAPVKFFVHLKDDEFEYIIDS